jgi:hypothetical protein
MARIEGAEPGRMSLGAGLFVRLAYWATKRKLGKLPAPVQVIAHHPRNLWGYAGMEQAQLGGKRLEPTLKNLAELRVATLVGCPF